VGASRYYLYMSAALHPLILSEPFRIAHGTSATRTVLRVTRDGHTAEAPFVPYYGEDPAATLAVIERGTAVAALPRTARLAYDLLEQDLDQATRVDYSGGGREAGDVLEAQYMGVHALATRV
jgi:hypothetical protein